MTLTTACMLLFLLSAETTAHPTTSTPLYTRALTVTNTSKAGLAGGGDSDTDMAQFQTTGKVSWYYTWGLSSTDQTELEFVPMFWGEKDIADWTDPENGINATIAKRKPTAILGMNEPQEKGQSNLTPQQGADMWKTYLEPLRAQGIRLGSPAPSSAPSGKVWIQDFLTACAGGCTVDFIALHWYDVNSTKFINYLNDFHETFQKPIWVTEWSCQNFNNGPQCTAPDVSLLLNETQSFMDSQDWVERYSWFGALRNLQGVNPLDAMLTPNGDMTSLGKQYIGAEAPQTSGAAPIGTGKTGSGGGSGGAKQTGSLPGLPTGAAVLNMNVLHGGWWTLLSIFLAACLL